MIGFWVLVAQGVGGIAGSSPCDALFTPLVADSLIAPIVTRVDTDSVRAVIQRLQAFDTRYYITDSLQAARDWIVQEFQRRGADTVFEQIFTYNGTPQANIIARKVGQCPDSLRIVLGGHYDSISYSNPQTSAPGADDNGSGVALLLEVLRVLRNVPLKRTVEFVAFAAEEPGLVGSGVYAQQAAASGDAFLFYLNADMIGGDADYTNDTIIVEVDQGNQQSGNDTRSQALGDSLARAYGLYTPLAVRFGPIYASDYMPLEAEGFVTVGVFEDHWNSTYHSPDDVIDSMDVGYATEVIRGVAALVVALAGLDTTTTGVTEALPGVHLRYFPATRRLALSRPAGIRLLDPLGRVRLTRSGVRFLRLPAGLPPGVYGVEIRVGRGKKRMRIWVP